MVRERTPEWVRVSDFWWTGVSPARLKVVRRPGSLWVWESGLVEGLGGVPTEDLTLICKEFDFGRDL